MTRTMWLGVALVVGACAVDDEVSSTEQAATVTVSHKNWSGKAADTMYFDPATQTGLFLSAFEDRVSTGRVASLWIDMQAPDLSSASCWDPGDPYWCWYTRYYVTRGWQTIPSDDYQIKVQSNNAKAVLHTTLSIERCLYDNWNWWGPVSCETISLPIDMTWRANGRYSQSFNGTSTRTDGAITYRDTGNYSSTSTDVNGIVGALSIVNSFGNISDSKNTNVTRDVLRSTP